VLQLDRLPKEGETVGAASLQFFPGGKGANQAAAAAKLGWPTALVGQLGQDSNADELQAALQAAGVDLQHVSRVDGPSGTAVILLQASGGSLSAEQSLPVCCHFR
jgi:ribokinase